MSKIVGKARALQRGYYPVNDAGNCAIIEEGQEFDLFEGHEKGRWFEVISLNKPAEGAKPKAGKAKQDDTLA